MIAELTVTHEMLPAGARHALDACALALGATQGPVLLLSAMPLWEHALRIQVAEQLFMIDDPARPPAAAWVGAVWLEPQRQSWRAELQQIRRELPRGALLSVVFSLPLAFLRYDSTPHALGVFPGGFFQLRSALRHEGFRVERAFGFNTLWARVLRRLALRLERRRPDLSDRLHYATRESFATRGYTLPLAATGLIEARAGMRP